MLNFLATTENLRKIGSEQPNYNRGKVIKKNVGVAMDRRERDEISGVEDTDSRIDTRY